MTAADALPPRPTVAGNYIAGDQHITQHAEGDIVGRDKIINHIQNIIQRALSAAEEAEQLRTFEQQRLAQGVAALLQRLQARAAEAPTAGNPYKDLLEYRLGEAEIFFGRQSAVTALLSQLGRAPLTVLQSESGAGKTSLLQAGLAPALLASGHCPLYLRPYNVEPGYALKRAFLPDLAQVPELATAPLREFLRQVGAVLGPTTTLYICLDQFEEFFTQLIPAAQVEFARELADCAQDPSLNVRWLMALRSEYFGRLYLLQQHGLRPFENVYTLLPLNREQAREVVEAPAAGRGVSFEPGLVDHLLDDLGQTAIAPPQLQLVCAALFDELPAGAAVITQALYEQAGGVPGILRGHLERVLSRDLPREQRAAARHVLEALVSSEQQRTRRTRAELAQETATHDLEPAELDAVLPH